ncbi:GGDEF domain-containing phosphodiesterase [Vibrio sp. JC009]|uniref:GGDEF domain-containing phosphodiesterase n=1 Tax=Vibrio sp. JC009 TaxID=2912314 RepID=UPI0023B18C82|nr:GGDEF domain-containing phosphodiesterase [Vibrio sp. JC009]WED23408.1 GGDEF domain-containing phosphodiesterase [Vibrio sp. JC009]
MENICKQIAAMEIAFVLMDKDCTVLTASDKAVQLFGCKAGNSLFQDNKLQFLNPDYESYPFESELRARLAKTPSSDIEVGITSESFAINWYRVKLTGYEDNYILFLEDITELVGTRRLNKQLSERDSHTGLFYREAFLTEIKTHYDQGTVCCIRICNYQRIKEIWGTAVANLVFMEILARVQSEWEYAICCKHSIDSFNIFVDSGHELEIEPLYNRLNEPFHFNGHNFFSNIALGYYQEKEGDELERSLNKAEMAILDVIDSRHRLAEFQEELASHMEHQTRLEATFQHAINSGAIDEQFEVVFQPLNDEKRGTPAGAECLMRWKLDGSYVSPVEFIPIAERLGEISELTYLTIRSIASIIKKMQNSGLDYNQYIFAVNISVVEILDVDFVDKICNYINKHQLSPKQIKLELTESAFIDNFSYVNSVLTKLQHRGFRISIDDFGTGFSSLSYLCRLNFDEIKIDKSFVDDVVSNRKIQTVFNTIVSLAQNLDKPVVAEGVEYSDQLAFARIKGIQYVQGYYYSKPLSSNDFVEYLLEHQVTA